MLINTIKSILILLSGLLKEGISFFNFISASFVSFMIFLYLPDLNKITPESHYEFTGLFLKGIPTIIEVHACVYIVVMGTFAIGLGHIPPLAKAFIRIYDLWRKQPLSPLNTQT